MWCAGEGLPDSKVDETDNKLPSVNPAAGELSSPANPPATPPEINPCDFTSSSAQACVPLLLGP